MFDKLTEEHRKEFIRQTFVYMPISLLFGIVGAHFLLRFIGFEITLGGAVFAIIFIVLTFVWSLSRYYRKLLSDKENKQV